MVQRPRGLLADRVQLYDPSKLKGMRTGFIPFEMRPSGDVCKEPILVGVVWCNLELSMGQLGQAILRLCHDM
jgi:hypothetical protein